VTTRLHQVLTFVAVPAGGQATLAHSINVNGLPTVPDLLFPDNTNFSFVAGDAFTITVENTDTVPQTLNLWLFLLYSPERAFGNVQTTFLTPNPFWVAEGGSGGGGSGHTQTFRYTVTGLEPDLANLVIPVSPAQPDGNYQVVSGQGARTFFYGMAIDSQTGASFVLALSAAASAGDVFEFILARN